MAIENRIVIKKSRVANVIVVDTKKLPLATKCGGDYFLRDQPDRPGKGWHYSGGADDTFTNPFPGNGVAEEKIVRGKRQIIKEEGA